MRFPFRGNDPTYNNQRLISKLDLVVQKFSCIVVHPVGYFQCRNFVATRMKLVITNNIGSEQHCNVHTPTYKDYFVSPIEKMLAKFVFLKWEYLNVASQSQVSLFKQKC